MAAAMKRGKKGTTLKGVSLTDQGTVGAMELNQVRQTAIDQMHTRFSNRSILHHLGWLDLTTWPDAQVWMDC